MDCLRRPARPSLATTGGGAATIRSGIIGVGSFFATVDAGIDIGTGTSGTDIDNEYK